LSDGAEARCLTLGCDLLIEGDEEVEACLGREFTKPGQDGLELLIVEFDIPFHEEIP